MKLKCDEKTQGTEDEAKNWWYGPCNGWNRRRFWESGLRNGISLSLSFSPACIPSLPPPPQSVGILWWSRGNFPHLKGFYERAKILLDLRGCWETKRFWEDGMKIIESDLSRWVANLWDIYELFCVYIQYGWIFIWSHLLIYGFPLSFHAVNVIYIWEKTRDNWQ